MIQLSLTPGLQMKSELHPLWKLKYRNAAASPRQVQHRAQSLLPILSPLGACIGGPGASCSTGCWGSRLYGEQPTKGEVWEEDVRKLVSVRGRARSCLRGLVPCPQTFNPGCCLVQDTVSNTVL